MIGQKRTSGILPMHAPDPKPNPRRLRAADTPCRWTRSHTWIAIALTTFWAAVAILFLFCWIPA